MDAHARKTTSKKKAPSTCNSQLSLPSWALLREGRQALKRKVREISMKTEMIDRCRCGSFAVLTPSYYDEERRHNYTHIFCLGCGMRTEEDIDIPDNVTRLVNTWNNVMGDKTNGY